MLPPRIMPLDRMTHAIEFLTGEVQGLSLAIQALAKAHPDPAALKKHLDEAEQRGLAEFENLSTKSEAPLEGYRFAMDAVQKALVTNSVEGGK